MPAQKLKNALIYFAIILIGAASGYAAMIAYERLKSPFREGDYTNYLSESNVKVILYRIKTCQFCNQTRDYLKKKNIPYADLDVDTSEKARQDFKQLKGDGVPLVLIGDRLIEGFNPLAFDDALNKAGLQKE